MVTTRTGIDTHALMADEYLRNEELARAEVAAQRLENERHMAAQVAVPTQTDANGAGTTATITRLLDIVSSLQVQILAMQRGRPTPQRPVPEEEDDDQFEDGLVPGTVVPDRSRVMSHEELSVLTYGDLSPAECHDSRFAAVLDYRYYRLIKRSDHYTAQTASRMARWTRQIEASFKLRFSGADPLAILQFLGAFVDATNANGIREGAALFILPSFLDSPAREEFNAHRPRAFPLAVNWLIATFAPVESLASEYKRISNLQQGLHETPRDFSLRVRTASSRLGSLMDAAAVSILLEGLHPSLSGFVRSALRSQKHTFSNVIQEAELIHKSVKASNPSPNTRLPYAGVSRSRPEVLRPYREATPIPRPAPVLAVEDDQWEPNIPDDYFFPVKPPTSGPVSVPEVPDMAAMATAFDEKLVATLSQRPQQVRYCYTCWRPGHFSAECPLIPKGERDSIAKRRAEIMRTRSQRPPYANSGGSASVRVPTTRVEEPRIPMSTTAPSVQVVEQTPVPENETLQEEPTRFPESF